MSIFYVCSGEARVFLPMTVIQKHSKTFENLKSVIYMLFMAIFYICSSETPFQGAPTECDRLRGLLRDDPLCS